MFVPVLWLKDYVDIPEDLRSFTTMMTRSGTMVEGYEKRTEGITNVVTGKVVEIERHPDSDHMWITKIDDNSGNILQIVTGAQNVKLGDIVPVARHNSVIGGGVKIKKSKLRGVPSEGMLCSADELGIDASAAPKYATEGIYILPQDTPIGENIVDVLALEDTVIEFELTNNRQDCNSILGIAYEAGATLGKKFAIPDYRYSTQGDEINKYLSIEVKNFDLCRRYTARMLKIKKIEESPMWMQLRLMSSGVRPINNVVDASNFVMLETGQPLHTFDYHKLAGGKIVVKNAEEGEKFVTLDNVERTLKATDLMICDGEKAVCAAGVMGGLNSDIDENTTMIVIEAANFDKVAVKNTSRHFGIRTESSAHFEKGISMHLTQLAADRCASLLVEMGAAEYIDGIIDVYEKLDEQNVITICPKWANGLIGAEIPAEDMVKYLDLLDMNPVMNEDGTITVTSPLYRQDIEIKEDVCEEIARIYGYENIPCTMMEGFNYTEEPNRVYQAKQKIKSLCYALGGNEVLTYTFISPAKQAMLGFSEDDIRSDVAVLKNPLGEENSVMRTSMFTSMADVIEYNSKRKYAPVLLFELGGVFLNAIDFENGLVKQAERLVLGKTGCDFYEMKANVNYILDSLMVKGYKYVRANEPMLHPGRSAEIRLGEEKLGYVGQIHPSIAKTYGIDENTVIAELDADKLVELYNALEIKAKALSKYPVVERDLALVCNEEVMAGEIIDIINRAGVEYLISVNVFDVYRSEALGENVKSIAYTLRFQKQDSTLTDEEIETAVSSILAELAKEGIRIRE